MELRQLNTFLQFRLLFHEPHCMMHFLLKDFMDLMDFMTELRESADPKACENISDEEVEEMRKEMDELKERLEQQPKENANGSDRDCITEVFNDMEADESICTTALVEADKITPEMISAKSSTRMDINQTHNRSKLGTQITAGRVFRVSSLQLCAMLSLTFSLKILCKRRH